MGYTIGQVAEQLGITVYTLHYYDKAGILPVVDRALIAPISGIFRPVPKTDKAGNRWVM